LLLRRAYPDTCVQFAGAEDRESPREDESHEDQTARGHAPVRLVRHGETGGDAGVPQNPTAKATKKARVRDASTHQGIPPCGQLTAPQKNGLPNLSQPRKMPHCLFDRILWIWMTFRASKSFDTSKNTTKPPANDLFERIPGLREPGIDARSKKINSI
jgi:hypothetical protein